MLGSVRKKFLLTFIICVGLIPTAEVYASDYPNYSTSYSKTQQVFADYMQEIKNRIQKTWNPPDFMMEGHALIVFKVLRNGELLDIRILESSKNALFDESSIEAVRKSAPFKPFPQNTTRETITIKYSFDTSVVKTEKMKEFLDKFERYYNVDNKMALNYINLAINEVQGDIGSYFLYGKRSKLKRLMGDTEGAQADLAESMRLKAKHDKRRICMCKLNAENEQTPFAYFYLANAYDIAGDYKNAIEAIDKAISMTELNNQYKRYREELVQKSKL